MLPPALRPMIVSGVRPGALAQHFLQCDRAAMFFQEIAESLVREVLQFNHSVFGQAVESILGWMIESNALANVIGAACH